MTRQQLADQLVERAWTRLISAGAAPPKVLLEAVAEMVVDALEAVQPPRGREPQDAGRCYTCDRSGTIRHGATCDKCEGEVAAGGNCGR